MKLGHRSIALALLTTALALSVTTAGAEDEASHLQARGKAERYVVKTTSPKSSIDTGGAAIFVNAPIATIRQVVTDYRHYDRFIKPFDQSRVLSRKNGVSEVYLQVPILHGAASVWAVVKLGQPVKDGGGEKIEAKFVRGNVDDFRAVWRLRAVDETHTIVKLEILVDPKLPLPGSMVTPELSYAADKAVTAVRERAERPAQTAAATRTSSGSSGSANIAGR